MKYLEIIPDFLSKNGVFTSQNTSQIRQEKSTRGMSVFECPCDSLDLKPIKED